MPGLHTRHKRIGYMFKKIASSPWVHLYADVWKNRTVTLYSTVRMDIENSGGTWLTLKRLLKGLEESRNQLKFRRFVSRVEEFKEGGRTACALCLTE
jgi:protease I